MRRIITLIPALIILVIGFDPTLALVLSQVVLSFGIPFALIPLVRLTSLRDAARRVGEPLVDDRARGRRGLLLIALNATLLVLVLTGS